MRTPSLRLPLLTVLALAALLPAASRADIIGFQGPWAPVDAVGNLINGFNFAGIQAGQSASLSLSDNNTVLTIDFNNPNGLNPASIFGQNNGSSLPSGTVDYDWSITFFQTADWLFETDVFTDLPSNDQAAELSGTLTGSATLNYTTGSYFSYGNVQFASSDALSAEVVLTNFVYTGAASVPEPATIFLFGAALLGIALYGKHRTTIDPKPARSPSPLAAP